MIVIVLYVNKFCSDVTECIFTLTQQFPHTNTCTVEPCSMCNMQRSKVPEADQRCEKNDDIGGNTPEVFARFSCCGLIYEAITSVFVKNSLPQARKYPLV